MNSTRLSLKYSTTRNPSTIFVKIPSSDWIPSISLEIDELEKPMACRGEKKAFYIP